jgi:hypothetical protein
MVTECQTLTLQVVGEPPQKVERKYETIRQVQRLYGFSIGGFFLGVMRTEDPQSESHVVQFNSVK